MCHAVISSRAVLECIRLLPTQQPQSTNPVVGFQRDAGTFHPFVSKGFSVLGEIARHSMGVAPNCRSSLRIEPPE